MKKTVFLLFLVSAVNCECGDDGLSKVCPTSRECWLEPGQENTEQNIITGEELESVNTKGLCSLGHTACNEDKEIYCADIVYPTDEVCDFEDNDCDGVVDEDFDVDNDGQKQCAGDCDDNDDKVYAGAHEYCDGKDNDCDDQIDEIAPRDCYSGPNDTVFDEPSPCKTGIEYCEDGGWSDCRGEVTPQVEICDKIDNDCDGDIDNDVIEDGTTCGPTTFLGMCKLGTNKCYGGEVTCFEAIYPQNEVCNNKDDDCDGYVDNGLYQECTTICGKGIEECLGGNWYNCSAPQPTQEYCDGLDNDCDGEIDEDCLCAPGSVTICQNNVIDEEGVLINCGAGTSVCDETGQWGPCLFATLLPETCNNWDDDCDGEIDGMSVSCGDQATDGVGECQLGMSKCEEGEWGVCEGEVLPTDEVCDGLDNDCDGDIDEDLDPHEKVDMVFAIDGSGSMCQYIDALLLGISTYVAEFEDSEHKFALVVFPFVYDYEENANIPYALLTPGLVDVGEFLSALSLMGCGFPSQEPSYDVVHDLADSADPVGIGWRDDAYPYIITITDEYPQSFVGHQEIDVATKTLNCQVGECTSGDRYEFFVITLTTYFTVWDFVAFNENERMLDINPADGDRYTEMLRGIFTNVCLQ